MSNWEQQMERARRESWQRGIRMAVFGTQVRFRRHVGWLYIVMPASSARRQWGKFGGAPRG